MATATAPVTTPERLPLHLDEVEPAPLRRPRVLLIATSLAAAASVALFAALFAVYFTLRAEHVAGGEPWLPDGANIPLTPGSMSMVTLVMSLVTVQWAVHAGRVRDRGHAYMALALTGMFGIAHVVQMAYLFTEWGVPLNSDSSMQGVLLFTVIGAHLAMVAAALVFLVLMLLRSLGGQLTGPDAEGLSAAALYWYVTVAIYAVIWYGILIVK